MATFLLPKRRHHFLVTRALGRCALSAYSPSVGAGQWFLVSDKYGRPALSIALVDIANLQFNVSHTKELVVKAVSRQGELGIDVENVMRPD